MLSKIRNRLLRGSILKLPITVRITIWYTFFIVCLLIIIVAASFFVTKELSQSVTEKELISKTEEAATDRGDFESFDEGIYFSIYSQTGAQTEGVIPDRFSRDLPLQGGSVQEYKAGKNTFLYMDVPIKNGSTETAWVRGIVSVSRESERFLYFPIGIAIASPFILLIIAFGGYRIIKTAFKPVRTIVQTASDIGKNRDFTKRIQLEEGKRDEISQMSSVFNEMLDSLENSYNHEKQFSADVSHELRTPVSVILAESQYSAQHVASIPEAKSSFAVIERQSRRMTHMINQILEISRLDRMETLHSQEVDLSHLVHELTQDCAFLAEQKNIIVSSEIEHNITIYGDKVVLQSAMDNLIQNAIKFTNRNVWISLRRDATSCVFEVADDGFGVPPEKTHDIWERFYQLDSSRSKEKNEGTGLGLSIVKKVVDLHHGEVSVTSRQDGGAVFQIKLFFFDSF